MSRLPALSFIAAAAALACARGAAVPTSEDIPEIMAEAAGTSEVSRRGDPPARRAVRNSFRAMLQIEKTHENEVGSRFARPELNSYFLMPNSFIGGDFPQQTATLLREVQRLEQDYVILLQDYPNMLRNTLAATDLSADERSALENDIGAAITAQQQPVIEAHKAVEVFVARAAELYELVARRPSSIKDMRTGLEIDDGALLSAFNQKVDEVNAARDHLDRLVRALPPDAQQSFRRMRLATPLARKTG